MRRGFAGCLFVVLPFALAILMGCSPKKLLAPNQPPETTVFIQGAIDTVSYRVRLYWFGTDPDGFVNYYEYRFLHPDLPADTAWSRTTRTDSLFNIFTPLGVSRPVFEVRAVDNEATLDPSPARQTFTFRNVPPTLAILSGPGAGDTTFAAATFTWYATDPDGDIGEATYRVWLDGNEATPVITTASTFTVPTAQFLQDGRLQSGTRTMFVQAIDAGGYSTPPESLSWYVRAPVSGSAARLLIVDDVPGTGLDDTLYTHTAERNLPDGTWSVLQLEVNQPFRSSADLEQTFKLFDVVIWYRGTGGGQPILTNYRAGVAAYLESGGRFLIDSSLLLGDSDVPGIFPEDWASRYLGSSRLVSHPLASAPTDTLVWSVRRNRNLSSSVFADSLRSTGIIGEMRGFAVRDTHDVVAWARAGSLTEGNPTDVAVGVTVPQMGGGRFVALTFSLPRTNGFGTTARFLAKLFQHLGLTG